MSPRVSAVRLQCSVTTSASRSNVSRSVALDAEARELAGLDIRIGREHAHPPRREQLRDARAGAPETHDADRDAGVTVSTPAEVGAVDRRLAPAAGFDLSRRARERASAASSISAIAPSATPPQFASVGQCVTSTPSALAASRSTSSTPIVYFATMRRSGEIERNSRSITPRNVAPSSASAPRASRASSRAIGVRLPRRRPRSPRPRGGDATRRSRRPADRSGLSAGSSDVRARAAAGLRARSSARCRTA